jgi:outer membrane protein assembly factor BamB
MRKSIVILLIAVACLACSSEEEPEQLNRPGRKPDEQGAKAPDVEKLTAALSDPSNEVRVAAADKLGTLRGKAAPAAPALVAMLEDKAPWVRVSAMETLAAIGPESVGPLVKAIETGQGPIRVRSVIVLGSMASDAKEALPALEKLSKDEALPWRSIVFAALGRIDPEKYGKKTGAGGLDKAIDLPEAKKQAGAGWAQFQGPNRDSCCAETGLFKGWTGSGPKLLWQAKGLGRGYSSVVISGGKIFTLGDHGKAGKGGRQCVIALDMEGKNLWESPIGPADDDAAFGTPSVDGQLLYAIGTEGDLVCMETAAGQVKWRKNFARDFGGKIMSSWSFSESPLVDGPRLVCSPGSKTAAIVALNKADGKVMWKCAAPSIGSLGKEGAGYASMAVAEIHGVRQYIQLTGRGVVAVDAATGKFLWGYNRIANAIANIPTPRVRGNYVFVTTGYRTGCALLRIDQKDGKFSAQEIYFLGPDDFENHHGGVVMAGDHVYGGSGTSKGVPVCIEMATGKVAWKADPLQRGSAAVLYADGHIIFRYDRGLVALAKADPASFQVVHKFMPPLGTGAAWAHPVIHDKRLYLRHGDILLCYDAK